MVALRKTPTSMSQPSRLQLLSDFTQMSFCAMQTSIQFSSNSKLISYYMVQSRWIRQGIARNWWYKVQSVNDEPQWTLSTGLHARMLTNVTRAKDLIQRGFPDRAMSIIIISSTLSRQCLLCIVCGSVSANTDPPNYWLSTQHEILHITFIKVQFKNIFKNIKLRKI